MPSATGLSPAAIDDICVIALLGIAAWYTLSTARVNLGVTAFALVAAFATAALVRLGWPAGIAVAAAVACAALAGLIVGVALARANAVQFAAATLVFGSFAPAAFVGGFTLLGRAGLRTASVGTPALVVAAAGAAFLTFLVTRSRVGFACAAVAQDERAAACAGINAGYVRLLAFVAGAAVAGLCGALIVLHNGLGFASGFGLDHDVIALAAVIIGGAGTALGPLVGAVVLAAIGAFAPALRPYRTPVDALLLLAFAVALPGGLASIAARITRK